MRCLATNRYGITLTGADEKTTSEQIQRLLDFPLVEIGLLYANSTKSNRYPGLAWLVNTTQTFPGSCAVHICGRSARQQLREGLLNNLIDNTPRLQINGDVEESELQSICLQFPHHQIITQYRGGPAPKIDATNHQMLFDVSGGRGISPNNWDRPETNVPFGFAGGLGPENIEREIPKILEKAKGLWWVDCENKIRTDDWFDFQKALNTAKRFHSALGKPTSNKPFSYRRVYNDNTCVSSTYDKDKAHQQLAYDRNARFGCALFLNGKCQHTGYLAPERIRELEKAHLESQSTEHRRSASTGRPPCVDPGVDG